MFFSSSGSCLCLNRIAKAIAIIKAYIEKESQIECQSLVPSEEVKYLSIIKPLILLPKKAPKPLLIIINKPWALERIFGSVDVSMNSEPEILKKSNAIP